MSSKIFALLILNNHTDKTWSRESFRHTWAWWMMEVPVPLGCSCVQTKQTTTSISSNLPELQTDANHPRVHPSQHPLALDDVDQWAVLDLASHSNNCYWTELLKWGSFLIHISDLYWVSCAYFCLILSKMNTCSYTMKWSEVKSLSRVQLFATPWTVAYQAPPSMGFSRQEYWNGLPLPSPGLWPP